MRRLPGQCLRLGIGHERLALVRTGRLFGRAPSVLAEVPIDAAPGPQGLARALAGLDLPLSGWPVAVVLADELVRLWPVAPPPAAATLADLEAAAAMRYQALFGAGPGGWTVAADWRAGHDFLAAAVPGALLDVLRAWSRDRGCHLVEVVPQLVAALNAWRRQRRPEAWFGVVQDGVMSLAAFDGTRLAALRSAPLPPGAGRDWLDSLVAREALRLGLERPRRLQVCGAAPRAWAGESGGAGLACTLVGGGGGGGNGGLHGLGAAARLACSGSAA